VRTYNSLDPRTSQAFGAGWSSALDQSLVPDPDGSGALILTLADGQQVRFAKNSAGGYAAPQDKYAVISALSGGGLAVTDQSGTTYSFGQASGPNWLISQITDASGRSETFTYSSGVLTTISSTTSGRALHLTWNTPGGAIVPHVATVSTDPVTVGQSSTALTWTYGYSGDLLTSVCPPGTTTACTKYTYITNGSHAPTAVLNANPTSFYRLDEPSGTTVAVNQIPVNDLTTMNPPASEFNTTPGVAGPVTGTTATGFNGTSSFIPLDGVWCTTPGQISSCIESGDSGRLVGGTATSKAISIWFKTTSASGVLLSLTPTIPGSTSIIYGNSPVNLLQIAGNGDLQGYGSCSAFGSCTWMSSSAPVDDGAWHQAVLIPSQALYLDGKQVATYSFPLPQGLPAGAAALLGTGEVIDQSGNGNAWSYFNGSIADLSIYQNQLPSLGTVAAQYAAETHPASELSAITSPGGRTEMSATYDTVNDRVATLTDAHGGSWTYSGPVSGSSSAAYADAALGSSPEDFWPLSDSSGPLAHDMVGGSVTAALARPPATYANVTLGVAGPTGFPDGTAASFSGSGSQISIPGGYFAGNGAESMELWFQTTTAGGTLLSTNTGSGGDPPALWIDSTGCLLGKIGSWSLGGGLGGCAPLQRVTDGKWHQVILTITPITTSNGLGSGTNSQSATLYLDGAALYTLPILTPATLSSTGYVAYIGNGSDGDFTGSIADVSFYNRELTSSEVSGHYSALNNQVSLSTTSGLGQKTTYPTPTLNTQTITVGDPVGKSAQYVYATGNLVRTVDALGGFTYYGYDSANRASTITNPDGGTTYTTHDAHNNVTSTTTCASVNNCQTAYTSYYEDLSNVLDPRNDKPADSRDARSSSPSDPAYDTVTTYTPAAQIASVAKPPTSACPSGCKTTYAYTAGTEAAVGGGTEPAGLVAKITAPGGGVASYQYDSAGDLMQTTSPLGLVTKYAYDSLGRQLTQTQISDTYASGLTTSYTYDGQDRVLTETAPPITDRVTGAIHTKVTTHTYDPDDQILTTTVSDATGGDPSRTTTDTYDAYGNLASTKDALGNTTAYSYDGLGDRITQTNPAAVTTAYTYDAAGNLLTTTLDGYTGNPSNPAAAENLVEESRAYDPAGRLASVTNGRGVTTDYTYFGNNQVASNWVVDTTSSTGKANVHAYSYDAAGNRTSQTVPGGLIVNSAYDGDNHVISQTEDPSGVNRTTTATYDADGNVVSESMTGGGVTQAEAMTYNAADQMLSQTTDNTGGNLTTSYKRDQRGLVISETDPAGNTTTIANDEDGRAVVKTAPAVASQTGNGSAPVTASPVTATGYDTFGGTAELSDANGNITKYAYDQDGHQVSVTEPSYTPPGASSPVNGTTTIAYDNLGQETNETDPLGNTTKYGYDQLGDRTSETDPGGGVTASTYDVAGEQTSVTDPTGAQSQTTYDNMGQVLTTTELIRQNSSAAYTTSYTYDDAGHKTSVTSPTGVITKAAYDAVGEQTSVTDGAGNTTTLAHNLDGAVVKTTLPDGTWPWNAPGHLFDAAKAAASAAYDAARAALCFAEFATLETAALAAQVAADLAHGAAKTTALVAKGADKAAQLASRFAVVSADHAGKSAGSFLSGPSVRD
jgi:YD repeat-containing protein